MDIKDRSAFPVMDSDYKCGMAVLTCVDPGVSALELIACNAPVDIPSWFKHVEPEKNISKNPSLEDIVNEKDRELALQWSRDPIFDLPDHLKWFSEQSDQSAKEYQEWTRKNLEAKYFQWRRFYAEQLLSELSK